MARYLLIEFDDNASADALRAQIDDAEENGRRFRVVAMFSKATVLCTCPVRSDKLVHGAKFRWWLCPECRRPKSGSGQTLVNMLDDPGTPAKYLEIFLSVRWYWDEKLGRVRTARSLKKEQWK